MLQAKGFPYTLADLLGDEELARYYRGGEFVTLRLTSSMYHRFHAPYDCRVEQVDYISGDTWNVNPIALKRVERLFCKNERAVIRCRLPVGRAAHAGAGGGDPGRQHPPALSRRALHLKYRGPERHPLRRNALARARRWAGSSTARPSSCSRRGVSSSARWREGGRIRMGQALLTGAPPG